MDPVEERVEAALMADQLGSEWRWGRRWRVVGLVVMAVERRESLKERVRLERARLGRELVVVGSVAVVVVEVKLRSRSEYSGGGK